MRILSLFLLLVSSVPCFSQQPDRTVGLLQRLSDAAGPPGAEEPVRAIMVPEMKP
jgi:hypothetical protein